MEVAGANADYAFRFALRIFVVPRRSSRVAQLFSLGHLHAT